MKFCILIILSSFLFGCRPTNQENKDIIVVAHRGASGYLPEHTLEAVAMAHSWGVDYIEPDLVMTKDDRLVVLHDPHLDTTTNVAELFSKRMREDGRFYVVDFTLNEIKQLRVHERMNLKTGQPVFKDRFPKNKSDFRVPTFEEYIELVQGLNKSRGKTVGIIPEIKAPEFHQMEGKDIVSKTLEVLSRYGYEENNQAIIQCFFPPTLKALKDKTKIPLLQLIADDSWGETSANYKKLQTKEGLKEIASYAQYLGPWIPQLISNKDGKVVISELVKNAHEVGLKVMPYTIRLEDVSEPFKTSDEMVKFLINEVKVDGLFSDFADRLLK